MITFLPKNLRLLSEIAAKGDGRYALSNIRLALSANGWYRAEASDGARLVIIQGPSKPPAVGGNLIEQLLLDAPNGATSVFVPRDSWATGFKLLRRSDSLGVKAGEKRVTFAAEGSTHLCDPVEAKFPDTDGMLAGLVKDGCAPLAAGVRVNPALLLPMLKLAADLEMMVEILTFGMEGRTVGKDVARPIGLRGQNEQGQFLDCLIMPLS